MGQKTFVVN